MPAAEPTEPHNSLEEGLAKLLANEAGQELTSDEIRSIAASLVPLVVETVFGNGQELVSADQIGPQLGLPVHRGQELSQLGHFPMHVLRLNGQEPVWLVPEVVEWNSHRLRPEL